MKNSAKIRIKSKARNKKWKNLKNTSVNETKKAQKDTKNSKKSKKKGKKLKKMVKKSTTKKINIIFATPNRVKTRINKH